MKYCSIENCEKKHHGRGFCYSHLRRMNLYGNPNGSHVRYQSIEKRFRDKIFVDDNGCHIWTAAKNADGYGVFSSNNERLAHRWAYAHRYGPIPDGMQLDHLCRVRNCVNPEHLEPVDSLENQTRSIVSRKVHKICSRGHTRAKENTAYNKSSGSIICKRCRAIDARARRARA